MQIGSGKKGPEREIESVMLVVGWKYAIKIGAKGNYFSMPKISRFWMYFPIPVAGLAMIIFELEAIYNHIKSFFIKEVVKQ